MVFAAEYVLAGRPTSPRRHEPDGTTAVELLRRWAAALESERRRDALRACLDWLEDAQRAGLLRPWAADSPRAEWLEDLVAADDACSPLSG